jgi:hypothetical protein
MFEPSPLAATASRIAASGEGDVKIATSFIGAFASFIVFSALSISFFISATVGTPAVPSAVIA